MRRTSFLARANRGTASSDCGTLSAGSTNICRRCPQRLTTFDRPPGSDRYSGCADDRVRSRSKILLRLVLDAGVKLERLHDFQQIALSLIELQLATVGVDQPLLETDGDSVQVLDLRDHFIGRI